MLLRLPAWDTGATSLQYWHPTWKTKAGEWRGKGSTNRFPSQKIFSSSRAGAAQEVVDGRSQCATHKLRATRAKFHSRSSTHLPPEQCLSQRLLLSAYVHSSGKMTILVSAPSFCQIITRQLDHKRKFGIVFREIYFDSFNCPFYKIITFVI